LTTSKLSNMKKDFFPLSIFLLLVYLSSCNNSNTSATAQNEIQAAPEVKAVFINGDSLHYIDVGKGDPVVFVHGGYGDYRTWGAQMDTFAKNHRVIAYSRRYFYPNNQIVNDSTDFSITLQVKDLVEFIKALNLQPVHVVGHSYGAFTALLATMDHPELVRSLTLAEPPVNSLLGNVPGGDTLLNNWDAKFVPVTEAFKNKGTEKGLEAFFSVVTGDSLFFRSIPKWQREIMMANTVARYEFAPVTCDDVKKIKTPVLLLHGNRSPQVFISIIDELNRCLPNKEKATLLNTSHMMEHENPTEFNKVVLGFIDKH